MKQAKFRAERCTYTFGGMGEENERPGKYMTDLKNKAETYRFRDSDEENEDYEEEDEEEGEDQDENEEEKQEETQNEQHNEPEDEEVVSEEE